MAEKEKQKTIELTQVPTGSAIAYKLPTGEVLTMEEYLAWMGNALYEIAQRG